jgi:threonine/homoserine/homoserine lactone efflux protein
VEWSAYGEYLALAAVLVLVPGPDFAVVTRNALLGGARRGRSAALGISSADAIQGTLAAAGLSVVILRAQPLFQTIRWVGVVYLAYLGLQAIRAVLQPSDSAEDGGAAAIRAVRSGWRQGFLSNITNPKVLVFYLAVLPQFLHPGSGVGWVLAFAWSHALLSLVYLLAVSTGIARLRPLLQRPRMRQALHAGTGAALLGFSALLASERF